jgi:type VI secretion system secreted protein Hcp
MAIYLKYGKIAGAVTTDGFKDWIECGSFQWGVGRGIGTAARGSGNREGSEPSLSEITLTKITDISSVKLLQDAWGGTMDNKCIIQFTTTTKNKVETYLKYELENVGLSGFSISSGSDGMPSESISLNFTKITKTFSGLDPATKANPVTGAYDLTSMTGS